MFDKQQMKACIFCGGTPLTGEHLLPNWMNVILPGQEGPLVRQSDKATYETGPLDAYWTTQNLGRKLTSWKVRVVCGACNNEWMNRLQTAARPALTRMILGEAVELPPNVQSDIVKWVVMTGIVGEFTNRDPRGIGLPHIDRAHLLAVGRDGARPEFQGWTVGIGHYVGSDSGPSYDHSFHELDADNPYGQSSSFVLGKLLIQTWRIVHVEDHSLDLVH